MKKKKFFKNFQPCLGLTEAGREINDVSFQDIPCFTPISGSFVCMDEGIQKSSFLLQNTAIFFLSNFTIFFVFNKIFSTKN